MPAQALRDRRVRWVVLAALLGVASLLAGATSAAGSRGAKLPPIDTSATIVYNFPSTNPTGDPHKVTVGLAILDGWERLFRVDWKGNIQPMLATSYSFSKDAKSLTLKLRRGVKFHDGTTFDATAVKASLDRAINLPGSAYATLFADIDSVNIVDPYTVRIDLKFGGAELIRNLAWIGGTMINPKCIAPGAPPIDSIPPACTTSPMVVDHTVLPNEWYFTRSPDKHWDPLAFRYAKLALISVANSQTIVNALQTGETTVAQLTPDAMQQAEDLIHNGVLQGKPYQTPAVSAIFFNPRKPPFNNPLLRKAVQAAVDPKTIALNFFAGYCVPTQQPAYPGGPFYNTKFKETNPYNPDKARQLLAQAGAPNGFSFDLYSVPLTLNLGPAQIMQSQLAKVGIKMNIVVVPTASSPPIRQGTADSTLGSWGGGPDPATPVDFLVNYANNRLASADGSGLEKQVGVLGYHALDPRLSTEQRGKVYQQLWKLAYDNALVVNVCALGQIYPAPKTLYNNNTMDYKTQGQGADPRYLVVRR
jgi:peptide/nickel transport system substrate-binding protein